MGNDGVKSVAIYMLVPCQIPRVMLARRSKACLQHMDGEAAAEGAPDQMTARVCPGIRLHNSPAGPAVWEEPEWPAGAVSAPAHNTHFIFAKEAGPKHVHTTSRGNCLK